MASQGSLHAADSRLAVWSMLLSMDLQRQFFKVELSAQPACVYCCGLMQLYISAKCICCHLFLLKKVFTFSF